MSDASRGAAGGPPHREVGAGHTDRANPNLAPDSRIAHDSDSAPDVLPETLRPEGWPRPGGYADGIVASGRVLVTAGEIGWDPVAQRVVSDRMTDQVRQALRNIVAILRAGGAGPEHLVRLTWYITDRDAYLAERQSIGEAYREVIGRHFPAMAVIVVAGLIEETAKVEIEATAVFPP